MNKRNIQSKKAIPVVLIALALACLPWPKAQAASPFAIVGLWDVHYFVGSVQIFETYDQWHSDGLEFEVNSIAPGAMCQGTWKPMPDGTVKLFHVGFTFGSAPCPPGNVRFVETQSVTVSSDGNSYHGNFDTIYYDANGGSCEVKGTMNATRLSVQ